MNRNAIFGMEPAAFAFAVMFVILGIGIVVALGAMILRAACWIYNYLASTQPRPYSPSAYPPQILPHLQVEPPAAQNPFAQPAVRVQPQPASSRPAYPGAPSFDASANPYASPATGDSNLNPQFGPAGPIMTHPDGVPEPSFALASGVVVVSYLVNMVLNFIIQAMIGSLAMGVRRPEIVLFVAGLQLVTNFFASAGVISAMLPTPYNRSLLIVLIQFVIGLAIGLFIAAVIVAVTFATAVRR